ncbi:amino acid ABC transporter permease [Bordetella genomosp. 11]|uniref:Amino acid ABC transporter permease n=1 Tax=Bordetella genomosp. 11 TaxID=1416808 RepID=A0A261UYP3_9BORD|nr:amino acid ABC transporter permease [Bordetella genomosp. 11]OZI67006.1 amino acid ABC transporter permease [Bordetella genomosp. 11]
MNTFSNWDIIRNLLLAVPWTLALSAIAFIGGSLLAVAMLVARLWKPATLGRLVGWYVQLFQGTPLLMQLFLAYFGLALVGIDTTPLMAATVCLILYACAYLTETWYGCVRSIPAGQWEASASLALNLREQLVHVIFPQTFRMSVPPTVGLLVQIVKNTSLASVVGFVELTRAGQMIANVTYAPFLVYGLVSLIYFAICFPCSLLGRRLERRTRIQY